MSYPDTGLFRGSGAEQRSSVDDGQFLETLQAHEGLGEQHCFKADGHPRTYSQSLTPVRTITLKVRRFGCDGRTETARNRKEVLCPGTRLNRTSARGSTDDTPRKARGEQPMGVLRNATAPKKKKDEGQKIK